MNWKAHARILESLSSLGTGFFVTLSSQVKDCPKIL